VAHLPAKKILIFIPTYNDREVLPRLIADVLALGHEHSVLVIDDGSRSPIQLEPQPRQYLFRSPYNAGLGAATNIAMDFALRHRFDVLVRIDADGQHPPAAISSLIQPIAHGEAEVIIGNRVNNLASDSTRDVLAGLAKRHVRFIGNYVTGLRIEDWHSGFMAFSRAALVSLSKFTYERFPEVEIIVRTRLTGLRLFEVPVVQDKRSHGSSSLTVLPVIRHLLGVYSILIRHALKEDRNG
jgi:glycosyltransferase involved in cell wall biosynthesis